MAYHDGKPNPNVGVHEDVWPIRGRAFVGFVDVDFSMESHLARVEQERASCQHDWQEQLTATALVCSKCGLVVERDFRTGGPAH